MFGRLFSQYHKYMCKRYKEYLGLYQYPVRLWAVGSFVGDERELTSPASLWVLALKCYPTRVGIEMRKVVEVKFRVLESSAAAA